jgi:hypothetical protein
LKPGPARLVDQGPGRSRSWNQAGLKKKQGKKKLGVTRLTRQDPVANPLTFIFCFLTKMTSF